MTDIQTIQSRIEVAIAPKLNQFANILEQYPDAIPIVVVADFFGTSPEGLRTSLREERCPVGYGWKAGGKSGFCIPTIRFYFWVTAKGIFTGGNEK